MKKIRVYRWRERNSRHGNFGDEITIPILERFFGFEAVPTKMHKAELLGAGSILDHFWLEVLSQPKRCTARERMKVWLQKSSCLHVWGSGSIKADTPIKWPQRLQFHAVRGTLTADRIHADNLTLGDPGILASRLIDTPGRKQYAVALIPNHIDTEWLSSIDLPKHWHLVDPERPVLDVISEIASAEVVVSSSLHGLITADSFDTPSVWTKAHNTMFGTPGYKFADYASSRGRPFNEPMTYEAVLALPQSRLEQTAVTHSRKVSQWQDEMMKAFPFN